MASALADLPLILAGPILRRVTADAVSVWVALREARRVFLRVVDSDSTVGGATRALLYGWCDTIRVGANLHVACVTGRPRGSDLEEGTVYFYRLYFGDHAVKPDATTLGTLKAFTSPGMLDVDLSALCYDPFELPSFVLPPRAAKRLRVLHGSCRKPHGPGRDALALCDRILADTAEDLDPDEPRPQQLVMSGDQIYADDVAPQLLLAIMDVADTLFGARETLPGKPDTERLYPLKRGRLLPTSFDRENGSHLLTLAEYATMYLLSWSTAPWPDPMPGPGEAAEIVEGNANASPPYGSRDSATFKELTPHIDRFRDALPAVRRVLANVATYMVMDDHEVTDDLLIDHEWTRQALRDERGRRILRNGLVAYALFQAWGNDPDQFLRDSGSAGDRLLQAIDVWSGSPDATSEATTRSSEEIERLVGLPPRGKTFTNDRHRTLRRDRDAVTWRYRIDFPAHSLIALDTRARRSYPSRYAGAGLIVSEEIAAQLGPPAGDRVTMVVSPIPPLGLWVLEQAKLALTIVKSAWIADRESWVEQRGSLIELCQRLFERSTVVVLSGDVHYAHAATLTRPKPVPPVTFVNYVASAFKNAVEAWARREILRAHPGFVTGPGVPGKSWQWRNLVGRFTLSGEPDEQVTFVDNNVGEVRVREVGGSAAIDGRLHVLTASGTRYLVTFGT